MDVFGKKPHSKRGEYFRNNVWWWHPLWDYCCEVDPELVDKVPEAHSNSGDGLNAFDARQLAFKLTEEIESGRTEKYVTAYYEHIKKLPKEKCIVITEDHTNCHLCSGTKLIEPFQLHYHINVENVQEFKDFLMDCGGFSIC